MRKIFTIPLPPLNTRTQKYKLLVTTAEDKFSDARSV